jgi:hypothetical protein
VWENKLSNRFSVRIAAAVGRRLPARRRRQDRFDRFRFPAESGLIHLAHDVQHAGGSRVGGSRIGRCRPDGVGARKVAESQLVKCSWYGRDPYWGRVASELGSAGITFEADKLSLRYGSLLVAEGGVTTDVDPDAIAAYMAQDRLEVTAHLGLGDGTARILTNDLSHAYIDENMGTS